MVANDDRPRVGEILLQAGIIDDFQLRAALGEQKRWGHRLGATLIKLGFVEERDLVRALATQLELPVAHLAGKRIEPSVLDLISVELAEKYMCMPLFVKQEGGRDTLHLGMDDPCDLAALDDIGFRTGMQISPVMVGPSDLCEAVDRFYHRRSSSQGLTDAQPVASAPLGEPRFSDELQSDDSEPFREVSLEEAPTDPRREAPGAPVVEERPARELPTAREPEPAGKSTAAPSQPAAAVQPPTPGTDRSRIILRAVTELLIEKGLLTRDEVAARVKQLEDVISDS